MTETFYDVLEVDEDASQEEITEAYREKVKEYHPDVSDEPDAGEVFKKVVQAEEVLGDPDERAKYDDMGHGTYVRRVMESNQAGSEQSPWTTEDRRDRTHDTGFGGMGGGFGGDGSAGRGDGSARGARSTSSGSSGSSASGGAGGASSYADSSVGFGKAAGRQAGADWTTGRSNNRWDHNVDPEDQRTAGTTESAGAGATAGSTAGTTESAGAGYSVRDWDQADAGPDTVTVSITQEKAVLGVLMFFFYPIFIWFSISPDFPTVVNVVIGMCTLLSVGYFLTVPKIGIGVFGAWSVISPVGVVVATDWGLGSSILAVAACWVPFGYSVVVAYFTMPD